MTTAPPTPTGVSGERRAAVERRVRWLVAAVISYNLVEAGFALKEGEAWRGDSCSASPSGMLSDEPGLTMTP